MTFHDRVLDTRRILPPVVIGILAGSSPPERSPSRSQAAISRLGARSHLILISGVHTEVVLRRQKTVTACGTNGMARG